jgi:hypothetical protein
MTHKDSVVVLVGHTLSPFVVLACYQTQNGRLRALVKVAIGHFGDGVEAAKGLGAGAIGAADDPDLFRSQLPRASAVEYSIFMV